MSKRVAITATLLNLLVCIVLVFVSTYNAARLQNELITEELTVTCRLSAQMLDSAAFVNTREEFLADAAEKGGMTVAFLEADGTVAYRNFDDDLTQWPTLDEEKMLEESSEIKRSSGEKSILVHFDLSDGCSIAFAKRVVTMGEVLSGHIWQLIPIVIVCLALQFFIVYRYVRRTEKLTNRLMNVLEDFSEGNYSSRITDVTGFEARQAARYNATLGRVQDKVFSQVRKNRVVGQMLNQMHNGLLTVDTNRVITFVTGNTGVLFNLDMKEAVGRNISEVFDNEQMDKVFSDAIAGGTGNVLTAETEVIGQSGAVRPLRMYTSTMSAEGKCTGALMVIEDITEIRKLEQIRTDFAANVSHEMKTPLTSIKGFIETLQAGAIEKPEMARKFLDIMMVEAERLTRLINDILSITKLESGSENVEITRIDLTSIIRYVTGPLLRPQAEAGEVTIITRNCDEPAVVMGNKDRVQQLILNLVENGVKYNKKGGTVTVTIQQDKENINLIVADTGIGIKEEHLERLFERFYRVDKGRSREKGGTGLGLAICKHIVNTMNGYIEVNSKYDVGTEFLVTLPKAPDIEDNSDEYEEEV